MLMFLKRTGAVVTAPFKGIHFVCSKAKGSVAPQVIIMAVWLLLVVFSQIIVRWPFPDNIELFFALVACGAGVVAGILLCKIYCLVIAVLCIVTLLPAKLYDRLASKLRHERLLRRYPPDDIRHYIEKYRGQPLSRAVKISGKSCTEM